MNYVAILIYKGMELVLDADGVWITPDPTLTVYMNTIFSPTVYPPSPTAGNSEYAAQARAAGTKLGTEPRWAPAPTTTERVY